MNIGFIGLGIMGGAYAKHLLNNKYPCFGIEPDKNNISKFMNLGGVLTTYSEIFDKVDVIISSLPSLEAYQNVLENIKKYKTNNKKIIILDMNTISIDDKIHFQNELQSLKIDVLDTPVSGTGAQADEADLTIFASGKEKLIKQCLPIFDCFSKEVINVGKFGNGMKFKILANLLVTIHNTAAAEALYLGEQAGLEKEMIYKVLRNSAASSIMLQKRMPLMIDKKYEPPTASYKIFLKDIDIIRSFIKNYDLTLPTFDGSSKIYDKAEKYLSNNLDTASVYELIKKEITNE